MLSKYFIINDNDCCCREKEPITCPICGRFHNFNYVIENIRNNGIKFFFGKNSY